MNSLVSANDLMPGFSSLSCDYRGGDRNGDGAGDGGMHWDKMQQ